MWDLIWNALGVSGIVSIVMLILQLIVNATSTEKDNDILAWIKRNVIDYIVKNKKKGGGVHPPRVPPELNNMSRGMQSKRNRLDEFLDQ